MRRSIPKRWRRPPRDIKDKGIRAIALTSGFAPVRPDIERQRGRSDPACPSGGRHHPVARSGRAGSHRPRERGLDQRVAPATVPQSSDFTAGALWDNWECVRRSIFSQNDGTLVSTDYATHFPIVTCSAGPTNSIRGAAFLTGLQDAIVMDIGGTTTDLGFLVGVSARDGDRAPHRRGPYEFPDAGCPVHCPGGRDRACEVTPNALFSGPTRLGSS